MNTAPRNPTPPIRIPFWSGASLYQAGLDLAGSSPALPEFLPFEVFARLENNQAAILANYLSIQEAARDQTLITPAAEWLLDNHHIVEENFRHLRRDLTPQFYRNLPETTLAGGTVVPRALALVWHYVAITDSALDLAGLTEMVEGYQGGHVLTIGEIWAVPALLRFVLLENLRRLSDRVEKSRRDRAAANALADELLVADGAGPEILERARARAEDDSFAAQLLYRLRDGDEMSARGLDWLTERLAERGMGPDRVVAAEHARQSSGNVTTGNIIRALRLIDDIDWMAWFETVSRVDQVLMERSDYRHLDKSTRNAYRDTVERIARLGRLSEVEVAAQAIALAGTRDDVGRVLLGDRLAELEAAAQYRPRWGERALRGYRRLGWLGLFIPVMAVALGFSALAAAQLPGQVATPLRFLLVCLAFVTASEAAAALVGLVVGRVVPPARLPAYDYRTGIPEEARTLVVIPCLLASYDTVDELLSNLELHYLANPRGAVSFALLSDWSDAPTETVLGDSEILAHARAGIEALAARYDHDGGRRFFLLHRRRLWNPAEGVWMGWERKRGKLGELNQILRGEPDTTFLDTGPRPPEGIRYVVTLDADTRLPRDSVGALVGKIAHPMNRPATDPKTGLVTRGHAILQPRVTPSLTSGAESSLFQRIFSANRGMDPYVFAVSDVYQDLLDEGSFTGKGVYAVDAFEEAMIGRIPENTVLSHDLLEGSFARAALVTDVQVIEDFPTRYEVDVSRQHRWARGDWQLLPFILDPGNGLTPLARMKMWDNLRRTLVPVAWVAASVLGWLILPAGAALAWQGLLLLMIVLVPLLHFQAGLLPHQGGVSRLRHLRVVAADARAHVAEIGLRVTFLAHLAERMGDAIGRTLYRMTVSRRHLLEWRTAQSVHVAARSSLRDYYRYMAASPAIGIGAVALTALINPQNLPLAAVFGLIWALAPVAAWKVSQPLETEDSLDIRPDDTALLRQTARITWRYFETFVTPANNHLPPDNYQEVPEPLVAERTSPTNIGLYLLSILTARDFGWIGFEAAVRRIEQTLDTLGRMEKHRGHLYNWYDTTDLRVLEPPYVSAVDSGNLAGHLVALASALKDWARNPSVYLLGNLEGVGDVLGILRSRLVAVPDDRRSLRPLRRRLEERIDGFARSLATYLDEPQLAPVRAINLAVIAEDIRRLAADLDEEAGHEATADLIWWANALKSTCDAMTGDALPDQAAKAGLAARLDRLAEEARRLAFAMDFGFLMDPEKRLLSIGYRPRTDERDQSCYDLLASEARLASFFAIAKGDLPVEHWVRLGRPVTAIGSSGVLLSWSGSMFEYLMPPLVMRERVGGILNQTNAMAVTAQIRHGTQLGVPWGVSESAFNARDREMNYQYYAFGVRELGLKRQLAQDVVIAPYASVLASQIQPRAAVANLRRLEKMGAAGIYGFYDAVDFTPSRLQEGTRFAVVRNYMAHHHGMTIVAIANAVLDGIHRSRFHEDPVIKAAELLLQEKAPREIVPITRSQAADAVRHVEDLAPAPQNVATQPDTGPRNVAVLSNGRFSALISATGAGSLRTEEMAVIRWHPDPTVDRGGSFLFLRDLTTGDWWSATTSPRKADGESAEAIISDHKAEFRKSAHGIESRMEVIVASEANAEGRRLTLRNTGPEPRMIEVTSYGEIVLDREDADRTHPAFSKMFVETEIRDAAILARRKPRSPHGREPWLAHLISGPAEGRVTEAETDRRAFLGRGRTLGEAAAFDPGAELGGHQGFTLDPCFALRRAIRLPPGKEVAMVFWTVIDDTREGLDRAMLHYSRAETFEHEARLAWTQSQVQLRHLDITLDEAAVFRRYAALLVYPEPALTLPAEEVQRAMGPQSALWPLGLSGDFPVFVLRIDDEADLPILRKVLRMHDYFRARGVRADLVVINDRASAYIQNLQDGINAICEAQRWHPGGGAAVFVVRRDQVGAETLNTLLATARVVLHSRNGQLADQLLRSEAQEAPPVAAPRFAAPARVAPAEAAAPVPAPPVSHPRAAMAEDPLRFWNGFGGFSGDGREYVIRLDHGTHTPHPWINVVARDGFGFHASAAGSGFTWALNSRDYQITPWSNDPVIDPAGEGFYVRDPETGRLATPFAALSDDPGARYEVRHGLGYSRFRVVTDWVEVEAVQVLAAGQPAKLTRLRVANVSGRRLRLEVAAYAELVLGNNRGRSAPLIRMEFDAPRHALLARNPYGMDFSGRATALAADRTVSGHLMSRAAFLGRNGRMARPAALAGPWPEAQGTDCDAAAALICPLTLPADAVRSVTFALADAPEAEIGAVLDAALAEGAAERGLAAAAAEWDGTLDTLQVETPDERLDLMVNAWLPYQALACRIRARTAFYQASGAFGFRDQLQDTSALILHDPALARHQILNAASRQFPEGDVQHWWLPASGAGVRTMISDDVVWLGHCTARYVEMTGDRGVLDEHVPFIAGRALEPGEHDAFYTPGPAEEVAPLYDHCARALDLAIRRQGADGLPLILGGDWNDGMNRVGEGGQGTSVWLGWFLAMTLDQMAPIAEARGDAGRAAAWRTHRAALAAALETAGWDGAWYRRASYDDGTPLGSRESEECRIDSIAQSWAAISGVAPPDRAETAIASALDALVDEEAGLIRLFTPPFEHTAKEPGYIKGYPPGVRENGGQYTHAATWMVYALARMGRGGEAHRLFDLINPVSHALTREAAERYRVEPYVVAADIYGVGDRRGRGGWTWYTGSAGWLYRAAVEGILGITMAGGELTVDPRLPPDWPGYRARIRLPDGRRYRVTVTRTGPDVGVEVAEDQEAGGAVAG